MQTLDEVKDENELKKKRNQKVRLRGLLIALNALLVAYCGYLTVSTIVSAVNKNSSSDKNAVTILNKDEQESLKILEKYISSNDDVLDIATYGRYLLTSNYHISPKLDNDAKRVQLINLTELEGKGTSTKVNQFTLGDKLDEQIDLFSLQAGDYIITDASFTSNYKALRYTGENYYSDVIYSFPSEDGLRTKITLKAKNNCPSIIISVTQQEASLPENYYDLVILNSTGSSVKDWFKQTSLKIIEVNSLKEAYSIKASYAINVIDGDDIVSSNYVTLDSTKANLISEGVLSSLDEDNAIRELGGYVFNAGYGISGTSDVAKASRDIKKVVSSSHVGKYTLTIGKDISSPLERIKSIFNF